jgi:hypothetical protein
MPVSGLTIPAAMISAIDPKAKLAVCAHRLLIPATAQSLQPTHEREVIARRTEVRRLSVLFGNLSEDFCDPSTVHLRADFRNRVLNVGRQLGALNQSIPVCIAVVKRINHRPCENAVAKEPALKGNDLWLAGGCYEIGFAKGDGAWRITAMTLARAWAEGNQDLPRLAGERAKQSGKT